MNVHTQKSPKCASSSQQSFSKEVEIGYRHSRHDGGRQFKILLFVSAVMILSCSCREKEDVAQASIRHYLDTSNTGTVIFLYGDDSKLFLNAEEEDQFKALLTYSLKDLNKWGNSLASEQRMDKHGIPPPSIAPTLSVGVYFNMKAEEWESWRKQKNVARMPDMSIYYYGLWRRSISRDDSLEIVPNVTPPPKSIYGLGGENIIPIQIWVKNLLDKYRIVLQPFM